MKQKDILFLSISIFIVIVAWVSFSIYHNLVFSTISQPTAEKIEPISPDFNTQVIENIKKKKVVQVLDSLEIASESSTVTSPPIAIPTPVINDLQSSPSAQGEATTP